MQRDGGTSLGPRAREWLVQRRCSVNAWGVGWPSSVWRPPAPPPPVLVLNGGDWRCFNKIVFLIHYRNIQCWGRHASPCFTAVALPLRS